MIYRYSNTCLQLKEMVEGTKNWLSPQFNMKDMGNVTYVLEIKFI